MTWIVGATFPSLMATLVSDTRMSWQSSQGECEYVDLLQKVHRINSRIVAGFAGDVEVGFTLIESLRQAIGHFEPGWVAGLSEIVPYLQSQLQNSFENAPPRRSRDCATSILIAGVFYEEAEAAPQEFAAKCIRFESPDFVPYIAPANEVISIGSGSARPDAAYMNTYRASFLAGLSDPSSFLHNDYFAQMSRASVGVGLRTDPDALVSLPLVQAIADHSQAFVFSPWIGYAGLGRVKAASGMLANWDDVVRWFEQHCAAPIAARYLVA